MSFQSSTQKLRSRDVVIEAPNEADNIRAQGLKQLQGWEAKTAWDVSQAQELLEATRAKARIEAEYRDKAFKADLIDNQRVANDIKRNIKQEKENIRIRGEAEAMKWNALSSVLSTAGSIASQIKANKETEADETARKKSLILGNVLQKDPELFKHYVTSNRVLEEGHQNTVKIRERLKAAGYEEKEIKELLSTTGLERAAINKHLIKANVGGFEGRLHNLYYDQKFDINGQMVSYGQLYKQSTEIGEPTQRLLTMRNLLMTKDQDAFLGIDETNEDANPGQRALLKEWNRVATENFQKIWAKQDRTLYEIGEKLAKQEANTLDQNTLDYRIDTAFEFGYLPKGETDAAKTIGKGNIGMAYEHAYQLHRLERPEGVSEKDWRRVFIQKLATRITSERGSVSDIPEFLYDTDLTGLNETFGEKFGGEISPILEAIQSVQKKNIEQVEQDKKAIDAARQSEVNGWTINVLSKQPIEELTTSWLTGELEKAKTSGNAHLAKHIVSLIKVGGGLADNINEIYVKAKVDSYIAKGKIPSRIWVMRQNLPDSMKNELEKQLDPLRKARAESSPAKAIEKKHEAAIEQRFRQLAKAHNATDTIDYSFKLGIGEAIALYRTALAEAKKGEFKGDEMGALKKAWRVVDDAFAKNKHWQVSDVSEYGGLPVLNYYHNRGKKLSPVSKISKLRDNLKNNPYTLESDLYEDERDIVNWNLKMNANGRASDKTGFSEAVYENTGVEWIEYMVSQTAALNKKRRAAGKDEIEPFVPKGDTDLERISQLRNSFEHTYGMKISPWSPEAQEVFMKTTVNPMYFYINTLENTNPAFMEYLQQTELIGAQEDG